MFKKSYKLTDFVKIISVLIFSTLTVFLIFEINGIKGQYDKIALFVSQSYYNTVSELIKCNSYMGGIYIPATEKLASVLQEELAPLKTSEGLQLVRLDAVDMTRLLSQLAGKDLDLQFNLVSLQPQSPENAADPWEQENLRAFQEGTLERKFAKVTMGGKEYYRYMEPLKIDDSCLRCHEDQGYEIGDVVGGFSVSLPTETFKDSQNTTIFWTVARYLFFLLLIGLVILFFARKVLTTQERLEQLAISDELTGLKNHRYLMERLEEEVERSCRYAYPLSILIMDLDKFKQINDTYGHLAGDWILKRVGQILQETVRQVDIPGRYGGDEFVVILPETTLKNAEKIAERIRQKVENFCLIGENDSSCVTTSIGVAQLKIGHGKEKAAKGLLSRADQALYEAKRMGGNRVVVSED